jgi:hypothetical protein
MSMLVHGYVGCKMLLKKKRSLLFMRYLIFLLSPRMRATLIFPAMRIRMWIVLAFCWTSGPTNVLSKSAREKFVDYFRLILISNLSALLMFSLSLLSVGVFAVIVTIIIIVIFIIILKLVVVITIIVITIITVYKQG